MRQRAEDILPHHESLPDDLYRRLVYFVDTYCLRHERQYRYGWGHLLFACYAAFPAHLSPDLLHKLRLNFRHYQQTPVPDERTEKPKKGKRLEPLEIPLVAVSDLLLSNLLRETGFERFEMPEELRHYLLWLLQRSHFFEKTCKVSVLPANEDPHGQSPETFRLNGIAEFLKRYANEHYTAADNLTRSLQEAQKWAAEAWQDPKTAANVLRERLAASAKPTDLYHYSRLGNRLGVQYDLRLNLAQQKAPAEFEPLRRYAQGVSALYTGKAEQAIALLGDTDQLIATDYATTPPAGAVRLPIPREVAATLLKQHPELLEKKSGLKPRNWQSLEARLRSPWPKAVLTIDDGDRPAIAQKLVRLENELQSAYQDPTLRLADYFDIVAGSGMGAFMAAMVVSGKTASEIAFLIAAMPPFNTSLEPTVFREYFKDQRFLNKEFRNGLLVALENTASNELNLAGNFSTPNTLSANNLADLLTLANRLEFEMYSHDSEAPMRSAYVLPINSLNLATVDALLEHQQNFGWNISPEQFLLVSIQEDLGADPIREQTRWIERHHLDLLGKHRMLVSQPDGEMQVAWPEAWRVDALQGFLKDFLKKDSEAIKYYDNAIQLDSMNAIAYHNRGVSKMNLGLLTEAIQDYNQAIELNPKYANAYQSRGMSKMNLFLFHEAIPDYSEAIHLNPDDTFAYYHRGLAKYHLGQYFDAILDYNHAILINPNNAIAYNERGKTKSTLMQYNEAIQDYSQAIVLSPEFANAYNNRGETYHKLGLTNQAKDDYLKALSIYPNHELAQKNLILLAKED